mmetsp:Transcript_19343/g.54782  ORF Transcript_19343/g.54782 Transcript_19343/m.54782 type:complete len:224 (+) Transcript_19343:2751-3422(+)
MVAHLFIDCAANTAQEPSNNRSGSNASYVQPLLKRPEAEPCSSTEQRSVQSPLHHHHRDSIQLLQSSVERIAIDDDVLSSVSTETTKTFKKSVSFSTVEVRTHEVVYGDHLQEHIYPITLGWKTVQDDRTYRSVDEFETCCPRRCSLANKRNAAPKFSALGRLNRLCAMGYTQAKLIPLERKRATQQALLWTNIQQQQQQASCKTKNNKRRIPRPTVLNRLLV